MLKITPFNHKFPQKRGKSEGPFSEFFDDFLGLDALPMRNLKYDTFKLNVKEEDDHYVVEAELPGIDKEDIFVDYYNGNLSVSVETSESKEIEEERYIHRESTKRSMRRTLKLGEIRSDDIEAELKDGILTIKAPKTEVGEKSSRIKIK